MHLDSPYARNQVSTRYTNGKDFMLTCRSNTVINIFGRMPVKKEPEQEKVEYLCIEKCVNNVILDKEEIGNKFV